MTLLNIFYIWLGVFVVSFSVSMLLRKWLPSAHPLLISFLMSLILVPAILFGVLPLAAHLSG